MKAIFCTADDWHIAALENIEAIMSDNIYATFYRNIGLLAEMYGIERADVLDYLRGLEVESVVYRPKRKTFIRDVGILLDTGRYVFRA